MSNLLLAIEDWANFMMYIAIVHASYRNMISNFALLFEQGITLKFGQPEYTI